MTQLLIRLFIRHPDNPQNPHTRAAYGNLASIVGMVCNVLLCLGKLAVGTLFGSIAIMADALNNLSDASSNIVSLVGFKLASRAPDAEHPFGHARYEYLAGLVVSVTVLGIGFSLLKESVVKVLHPTAVQFSLLTVAVLVASILVKLEPGDVLFIDEIHRLSHAVEEVLYSAMEDYEIDLMTGKGPTARSMRIALPKFTLVGATTRAGQLSAPLRDRFGIIFRLEMYSPEELSQIVSRSARILNVKSDPEGLLEIARRSRGTPRIANRMLKRVRDYAQVRGDGKITREIASEGLSMLDVDELGLDRVDRTLLTTMIDKFGGGPVGLDTLAASTGEDANTIEDVYEPYLLQLGFIQRTPRGRICTAAAYEHLGRVKPASLAEMVEQGSLLDPSDED